MPDSLPPFSEVTFLPRRIFLGLDDIHGNDLRGIIEDMYWFPNDEYFLYFPHETGIGKDLMDKLNSNGVEVRRADFYFYRHPNPAYNNDFIRVWPDLGEVPNWMREAAEGKMYGRVALALEASFRKQLDLRQTASAVAEAISDNAPIINAKPNLYGIGFDLNSLWRRYTRWRRRKKNTRRN